jgi:hypothetical protein
MPEVTHEYATQHTATYRWNMDELAALLSFPETGIGDNFYIWWDTDAQTLVVRTVTAESTANTVPRQSLLSRRVPEPLPALPEPAGLDILSPPDPPLPPLPPDTPPGGSP